MRVKNITPYIVLLRAFVDGDTDVSTFERDYLHLFKNDKAILPEEVFAILDSIFADVDAFCADQELRGNDDLNEEELRERCKQALEKVITWTKGNGEYDR